MKSLSTTTTIATLALAGPVMGVDEHAVPLRVSWKNKMLTIRGNRLPGKKVEVWYLEAFCRTGSTDRDWGKTTLPFQMSLLEADPDGRWLRLRSVIDGKVEGVHEIRAGVDEVDFRVELANKSDQFVDVDWAQPCIRVGAFTGRGQKDYFEKCFIFTEKGLVRMHQTHRAAKARYTPGQVYVPAGVNLNDVNPRPISKTKPVNGLVGCFSADEKMILATAWDHTQELFQGVIVCIHNDPHIGGLKPSETKRLHGKIYIVESDVEKLLERYRRDFPEGK